MDVDIWVAIIGAVGTFLAGGAVGGVVTARANWGIEKKRDDRKHKRELITSWRIGIASIDDKGSDVDGMPRGYLIQHTSRYFRTPWYETLRPHLSDFYRANFEKNNTSVAGGTPRTLKNHLADEVDRIEHDWGLRPVSIGDRKARRF